jgi:PGF-pre-PGF domain-containing protein
VTPATPAEPGTPGGPATPAEPPETPIPQDLVEDEDTADINPDTERGGSRAEFERSSVRSVSFQSDVQGNVRVQDLERVPPSDPDPPGRAATVVDINVPSEARNSPATVEFSVSNEKLEQTGVEPEDATVIRLSGNQWQPLPTRVEQTEEGISVQADVPGFSRFAVVDLDQTPTPTPTPTDTPTDTDSPTDPDEPTPTETTSSGGLDGFGLLISVVALAGAALLAQRRRD